MYIKTNMKIYMVMPMDNYETFFIVAFFVNHMEWIKLDSLIWYI